MTPYLQAVTQNSIYVLTECDSTATVTVEYGTDTSYGNYAITEDYETTTNTTYVHNIKLTGLQPDTLYHYRVSQDGAPTPDSTFRTAPLPGTSFRFAWMADCRSGTNIHDMVSQHILTSSPVVLLYGGDLCVDSGYSAFKNEFFRVNELALISKIPFFNATGNHEGWSTNTKAFTQAPQSGSNNQGYYSFDYGDMHVLVMNYMDPNGYGVNSPQYNFIQNDLSSTTNIWKIVICHSPAYCAGGHGEDTTMITLTTNIFEPNKVDMVLAGHSHFYQHNLVNGIHHIVIGSAGAPLHTPDSKWYTVKSSQAYNYAIFDITPTSLHMVAYNETGIELETVDLIKDTQTPTITVLVPNGGEIWQSGTTQTVTWTSQGSVGNVNIDLSTNSGSTWTTLVSNTANDGSEAITVPNTPSSTCRIRVQEPDGSPSDTSNSNFAINFIFIPRFTEVDTLDFGTVGQGETKTLTFELKNTTAGILTGTIIADKVWIKVYPISFNIPSGSKIEVNVTVDNNILNQIEGQYSGTITITSNGGTETIRVIVTATCVLVKPNPYNPEKGPLTFFGSGIVSRETTIKIYTLSGELVKIIDSPVKHNDSTIRSEITKQSHKTNRITATYGQEITTNNELTWDGKNESGKLVPDGIYLYTYKSPKEKGIGKFTVIRK